jgi:tetratricopeptide (TPR) repeat protein
MGDRLAEEVRAALNAADASDLPPAERAEMLMEIAVGLQRQPKSAEHIDAAIALYERALALCPASQPLLAARIGARRGTALQAAPNRELDALEEARAAYEHAIPVLQERGRPEEVAEAEMNHGLVLQTLASAGRGLITDAISAYQRALRTFDKARYCQEFAILQNNLATAFLSIPLTDERAKLREALAVQAFEEGLKVVNLIDHPSEYAMLQNNLGNALQYVSSSHALENNLRAVDAYDEALRVRTRGTSPLEYANTLSNKANCVWNLPDDVAAPERGNRQNLRRARAHYAEAREIFLEHGARDQARIVAEALMQIDREILATASDLDDVGAANPRDASDRHDSQGGHS